MIHAATGEQEQAGGVVGGEVAEEDRQLGHGEEPGGAQADTFVEQAPRQGVEQGRYGQHLDQAERSGQGQAAYLVHRRAKHRVKDRRAGEIGRVSRRAAPSRGACARAPCARRTGTCASSSKAVLCSRSDRTACRHKMASRTRRLIMVVRRFGVYRSGGWNARRAFRSCLRSFRAGTVAAFGDTSGGSSAGRTWVTASANSALDRTGVMVVTGCGLLVCPFGAPADDVVLVSAAGCPAAVPLGPFSEGMMTVSASVSMSGRAVGAGPKTERLLLPGLSAGASLASAAEPAVSARGALTPVREVLPKTRRRLPPASGCGSAGAGPGLARAGDGRGVGDLGLGRRVARRRPQGRCFQPQGADGGSEPSGRLTAGREGTGWG